MAITGKQAAFVDEYLIDFNATRAAERAHYRGTENTLASIGWENLRKPEIAKAIKERSAARSMTADEVIARLADQARGNMNDFVRFNAEGDPVFDLQSAATFGKLGLVKKLKIKTRTYTTVETAQAQPATESDEIEDGDESNTGDGIDLGAVVETTVEFELYSSQAALELIGKHHGLFDKRGTEDDPVHNVGWSLEEWRAEQEKRRQKAAETQEIFDEDEPGES